MPRIIFGIFILAVLIRFLYFPNVNFAYDQARDSFAALDILKGDLKIIGPATTISDKVFHGVLFYYLLAPIYFFGNSNPEVAAAIFRIVNALGVFAVFLIGSIVFRKEVGIVAALLYAVSFEQSQYSLFFGHPALGVVPVLLLYLGLALLIFKEDAKGWVVALLGLGLAFQFEDVNLLLFLNFFLILVMFKSKLQLLTKKTFLTGIGVFTLTISTFIISEIKYHFRMSQVLFSTLTGNQPPKDLGHAIFVIKRLINDNLITGDKLLNFEFIGILIFLLILMKLKNYRKASIFLTIWFFIGMLPNYLSNQFSYQYTPGASVALLILAGFLINWLWNIRQILGIILICLLVFSNLNLVISQNKNGPNSDIIIQPGMLTINERQAIDYIYQEAGSQPFSINALTVPLNVKTTWDYLFNWYGKEKFGYLPIWGGEAAAGFPGSLGITTDRSKLPKKRFAIVEPTVGIGKGYVDDFFRIENYFSKVLEEKTFGTIIVEKRETI